MISIAKPIIDDSEKNNIMKVVESSMLACGSYVQDFEEKFAEYNKSKYAVATSSGTTALHAALKACGIEEGDKVLTTPFTFIASSNSILYCGAEPVFADVEEDTFNIDPEDIRRKLEADPGIKALLIVHLYGCPCNMDKIMELVEEYNLILIEDCAQAHGAEYRGKKVGTFGKAAAFSFYPTKNMTTGEGGMILSNDKTVMEKAKVIINHGSKKRYYHEEMGYNYRMTNLAAGIGLAQLEKLDEFNQKRRENAYFFNSKFKKLKDITVPESGEEYKHVYHQYTVKVENREEFTSLLEENGIGYGVYYPLTIYQQPLYQKQGYGDIKLPVSDKLTKLVISLPVHPALNREELKKIVSVISDFKA